MIQQRAQLWRKRASNWLAMLALALVLWVFARSLAQVAAQGEAAMLNVSLTNLRSQLVIRESMARVNNNAARLPQLDGANPIAWLREGADNELGDLNIQPWVPHGYIGHCRERQPGETGVWCFDAGGDDAGGVLRYYPRNQLNGVAESAYNGSNAYVWRLTANARGQVGLRPRGEAQR